MASVPSHPEFLLSPITTAISPEQAREITSSVYLSRRDAALYMCVSEKFLATHLNDGPLRLRLGSKIVYRVSDIEDWMRQQEVRR